MLNFSFHNPTHIHFGKGTIAAISDAIPLDARVLIVYGGGSIKSNGVYEQVISALKQHTWFEFSGIEPNPSYETLMKAQDIIQTECIDYLLAVGGGSVVDGAKFIAAATFYEGDDPWDILAKQQAVTKALPIGAVLTLPATGSESNGNSVVTRSGNKLPFSSPIVRPLFAVLDPQVTLSLSDRQISNGVVDAFVHTIEQYLTYINNGSAKMTKKILMVLTSHDELGDTGKKTGFWVEEFAAPYYAFIDAGIEVTLATPKGGQAPIDPTSTLSDFQTAATERFDGDSIAQDKVTNTAILATVNESDFDGVFYPGGHGPLWDLTTNNDSIALIESFLNAGKAVATVCHASAVLLNAKTPAGEFAIKGKAVTGFTNSEEAAVQLTEIVPFLVEDELIKRGGDYQKAEDWHAFAIQDGLIITGQNPASSVLAADKLLEQIAS